METLRDRALIKAFTILRWYADKIGITSELNEFCLKEDFFQHPAGNIDNALHVIFVNHEEENHKDMGMMIRTVALVITDDVLEDDFNNEPLSPEGVRLYDEISKHYWDIVDNTTDWETWMRSTQKDIT